MRWWSATIHVSDLRASLRVSCPELLPALRGVRGRLNWINVESAARRRGYGSPKELALLREAGEAVLYPCEELRS